MRRVFEKKKSQKWCNYSLGYSFGEMYSVFSHRTCVINDGVLLDSLIFLFWRFRPTLSRSNGLISY